MGIIFNTFICIEINSVYSNISVYFYELHSSPDVLKYVLAVIKSFPIMIQ